MIFSRIAFIDFDGVTHPSGGPTGDVLPFEWVHILADLVADFPVVGIVVHSSWREQFSEDYLRDFLEPLADHFAGVVANGPKDEAIRQYLLAHPEVQKVAILDDEPDEVAGIPGATIVACPPLLGISCELVQASFRAWLEE